MNDRDDVPDPAGSDGPADPDPAGGRPAGSGDPWAFDDWIARRARRSPGAEAVVDAASGDAWSYAEFDAVVEAAAGWLSEVGVGPGDHLGTLLGTRVATVAVVHATARLGAVLVPLNPERPTDAVADRADRADVSALVRGAGAESTASAVGDRAGIPVASVDDGFEAGDHRPEDAGRRDPADSGSARRGLDDPAAVLFTSGTTGDPKAVTLTAGNLLASAVGSAFRLGVAPGDRWLCELPAYHMGGIAPFLRSALYGTAVVLQRRDGGFDPGRTLDNLRSYSATGVSLVPTQLDRLLDAGEFPDSLRFVLLGGGPAPEELIRRCGDRDVPVCPTYGMTETASQVTTARPREATDHPGTVGRPLAVTDVAVVDGDGDPLPPGEVGEVVVAGPTVTPGYYGDPGRTAAAFGEYGLHTGDLGRLDEAGRLWIHGRVDDLITTGGETVAPATVERAIRTLGGVQQVAVVGLPDPEWGQRVAALVVPEGADPPSRSAVREHCRERLAPHEVPKTVAFADSLPRTASGTVDREAVRERIRSTGE